MSSAAQLAVVLVEPSGPLNVGSVARLCANFDVGELRLVAPRCDHLGEEARRMAVHGGWLLEQARLFPSLSAALADCCRVVATSGRRAGEPLPLQAPEPALRWLAQARGPCALVFGREDRGLSNDELLQAGQLLTLGSGDAYASLNLSHAAALVLHSWHCLGSSLEVGGLPEPSDRQGLEAMLGDAEALLLEVGFLHPHTAHARMAKLRGLLQRAQISTEEVALVRGMVRQLRWASERGTNPGQTP
ncbi:tRNA (cytidine/uridine-2'-O-)-methyltransferase TrmJ [Cyanobium usitatum str. Tous]|uniref:RNA methyltransferase n=1 Tax=Cyanobium usitatum TaxID=2304190 RepID=UPI002AD4F530|nr:RNA methyltransferase [Cyanobium usitatum]CAK6695263.1 tRNA (cytidine/uridine-2'-O-)-methyltransferase TrmJ [Cyanobium usitatum str. Tous]